MGKKIRFCYDEVHTPIGPLTILVLDGQLCRVDFGRVEHLCCFWTDRFGQDAVFERTDLVQIKQQLQDYFVKDRTAFSVEFAFHGTAFQQKVWQAMVDHIPYGETRSYKEIAKLIGSPKAVRAVGGAINKNPLAIIVPCHRVIGSNGSLTGYNGGLDKKKYLLELEKASIGV